jgi:hypothetical protein
LPLLCPHHTSTALANCRINCYSHVLVCAVIIANERRSESVQSAFTGLFSQGFTFKKVPLAKQDPNFCHPAIELYILKKKKGASDASLAALDAEEAAAAAATAAEAAAQAQLAATSSGLQRLVVQEQQQQPGQPEVGAQSDDAKQQQQQQQQHQQQQDQAGVKLLARSQPELQPGVKEQPGGQPAASSSQQQPCQQQQQQQLQQQQQQQDKQVPWQTRRAGVEAARLLAAVQVPEDAGAAVKQ